MNKKYSELAELFRSEKTDEEILDFLLNYHKNDIADMMAGMTEEERKRLYHLLGAQKVAEIFKYIEDNIVWLIYLITKISFFLNSF